MPKETMSPRERWEAVLRREKPDRVPMDIWYTPEIMEALKRHLHCSDEEAVFRSLHIDRLLPVQIEGPRYLGPPIPEEKNPLASRYRDVSYGTGTYRECVYHPLENCETIDDLENRFLWSAFDPDAYDFSTLSVGIKGKEDYPIAAGHWEPYLLYKDLRGQELAFMDMILKPEMVHWVLDRIFQFQYRLLERIFETIPGKVLVSTVSEDMGAQNDLMYSPAQISKFFLPNMKKQIDLIHQARAFVFHHNDGAIRKVIPDLIDIGIDILNPIQWRCAGMDRDGLKRDFGDQVVFHGGVDNQHTMAFGSPRDVREEVLENLRVLGKGGGYILAPCHAIQPITPVENVIALYQTGYEYGWA
jgi:uroporphyrinogen decarboxylase